MESHYYKDLKYSLHKLPRDGEKKLLIVSVFMTQAEKVGY